MSLIIKDSDKSICRWSVQEDGFCPYQEFANMLLNDLSATKIRCVKKQCLKLITDRYGPMSDRDIINKTGRTNYLKPVGPANSTTLLNNVNIDEVLKDFSVASIKSQEFINGPFYHIPFEMRDFMQSNYSELRDIDFNKMANHKFKTFGCVLNTDVWSGPGEHWVCIFGSINNSNNSNNSNSSNSNKSNNSNSNSNSINNSSNSNNSNSSSSNTNSNSSNSDNIGYNITIAVEYFNSSGNGLDLFPELYDWIDYKKKEGYNISIREIVKEELQQSDTECGMWCLYYIKTRLEGHKSNFYTARGVTDDDIIAARKYLFTPR